MERLLLAGAVVWGTLLVGLAIQLGPLAPMILGGLLLAASVVAVRWRTAHRLQGAIDPQSFVSPIAASWLLVSLLPVHDFASRSSTAGVGAVGIQPVIELAAFCVAGLVALAAVRTVEPTLSAARPPVALFLLPIWIIASSTWSASGLYAMVRGGQMGVMVLLAWATVAVGRAEPTSTRAVVERYLRWFAWTTAALVALGVAFGPVFVATTAANSHRFTWIGAHPNGSGLVLSVAIVIVIATPATVLRLPRPAVAGLGVALLVAMHQNHSRAAWLCLAVGLLVVFALQGKIDRLLRWVGTPLLAAGAVAAVVFRGDEIWDYILRDRDDDTLATGNGRRELWEIGLRALETPLDWIIGLGYGITRTLFLTEVTWAAGEAHNSILAILITGGLVGLALLAVTLGVTVRGLVVTRAWAWPGTGIALTGLLVLVLVNGLATDVVAEPSIGFAVVNLVAAAAIVGRASPVAGVAPGDRPPRPSRLSSGPG